MKHSYFIFLLLLALVILSFVFLGRPQEVQSQQQLNLYEHRAVQPYAVGKESYLDFMRDASNAYNVSFHEVERIMDCENTEYNPYLQSRHRYTQGQVSRNPHWGNEGDREKSFGLVQIHLPAENKWEGEIITKEQAQDPYFSIEFLAFQLARGKGNMWSCY